MKQFTEETKELTRPSFMEIAYADLNADPLGTVEAIYEGLEIDGFESAKPKFDTYLQSIAGYQKNSFRRADETTERVAEAWRSWVEHWGYEVPA